MFKKMLIPGMIALTVVGCLAFSGYSYIVSGSLNQSIVAQEQEMDDLNKQLTEIETVEVDKQEVKAVLHTATQAGNDIAALQNYYASVSVDSGDDKAVDELSKRAKAVKLLLGVDDQNAAVPWYNSSSDYYWTFETTYSFSGNSVSVLWLCRDTVADGFPVLAYATADYDVEKGVFEHVKWQNVQLSVGTDAESIDEYANVDRDNVWRKLVGLPMESPSPSNEPSRENSADREPEPGAYQRYVPLDDDSSSESDTQSDDSEPDILSDDVESEDGIE